MPLNEQPYMPMSWKLSLENDETVLHCYLRMSADILTNFWLTGRRPVSWIQRREPNTACVVQNRIPIASISM